MNQPIPTALMKLGINSLRDNLSPGEVLNPKHVSRQFMVLFRTEMEDKILNRTRPVKPLKGELPCVP